MSIKVIFLPSGRGQAQCPSNPEYPDGIEIDASAPNRLSCTVLLPYPAPECGLWHLECSVCGKTFGITAAGRRDDPVSVKVECGPLVKIGTTVQ